MSKYRADLCENYVCKGYCTRGKLGKFDDYRGYCQECSLYYPMRRIDSSGKKSNLGLDGISILAQRERIEAGSLWD